jgi:hypothetical protein
MVAYGFIQEKVPVKRLFGFNRKKKFGMNPTQGDDYVV